MATVDDWGVPGIRSGACAVLLGVAALVLWANRDDIAMQFTSSYAVSIRVVTPSPPDKDRLERAFAAVQAKGTVEATLQAAANSHFNSAEVRASSPTRAVEVAQTFAQALAASFDAAGRGHLETEVSQRAFPVSDATSDAVEKLSLVAALVLGLLAAFFARRAWRQMLAAGNTKLPPWARLAVTVGVLLPVAPIVLPGWLFAAAFAMMIPSSIAGVIVYKMGEVRRAARWPSAQGRIVRSGLRTVDSETAGGTRGRGNVPDVRYVFSVDGVEYRGKRISIGEIPPDSPGVEAALELYQVGRTAPVYYNPDNPKEAVLERDPPVNPRTMYAISAGVMLVGFVVVGAFSGLGEIVQWLQPHFPPGAFIPGFLFFLACGLFAGVMMIASLATAQLAARWPTTPGTVITSQVESRRELTGGGASRTMVVWSPLVEYVYRVGTREYHGTRIGFGPTVSAGRDLAEAVIARYPEKATVTVHYHPTNPSQATLETHVAHGWVGLVFVLACFAAALFFSGRL
ncbi:hypothetical protein BH10PSE6_BH10PSE6_54280 [soil metagenome]